MASGVPDRGVCLLMTSDSLFSFIHADSAEPGCTWTMARAAAQEEAARAAAQEEAARTAPQEEEEAARTAAREEEAAIQAAKKPHKARSCVVEARAAKAGLASPICVVCKRVAVKTPRFRRPITHHYQAPGSCAACHNKTLCTTRVCNPCATFFRMQTLRWADRPFRKMHAEHLVAGHCMNDVADFCLPKCKLCREVRYEQCLDCNMLPSLVGRPRRHYLQ